MRKQPKLHIDRETLRQLQEGKLAPVVGQQLPTAFASCVIACPNRPFSRPCN